MNSTVPNSPSTSSRRRRLLGALTAASAAAGAIGVVAMSPETTSAARTWHVSPAGDDGATGSASTPLATIEQAVRVAESGDTIQIGPGVYHESVQVFGEQLTIVGSGEGQTVLDGAREVNGFARGFDGRFEADWSSEFDRARPPYTSPDRPHGGWPEQFFLDGQQLLEVPSRDDVGPGTFFHDISGGRVVLGDDPTGRLVEGSALSWGLYLNRADGTSVEGLSVRRYATEQRHMAAIRAYADDLTVRDVTVEDNARIGLSAIGDRITFERIDAIANGHLGIHGHLSTDLVVRDSVIHDNNREYFDAWHSAGGLKITESQGLEIRGNDVRRNDGPGIWTDLDVRDAVIAGNVVLDSMRSGIEIELSSDVIAVDNVVARSGEQGVWVLESSRVDVWHNHLTDNERAVWVLDGPRADLVDVRIGNNVLAGPSSAGVLVGVDDWTENRNAAQMRVVMDGNRYWTPAGQTGLVRWSNWPASLTIAADLGEVRNATGQESAGVRSDAAVNPFGEASIELVPTPVHVRAVRTTAVPSPNAPEPTASIPAQTLPGPAAEPDVPVVERDPSEQILFDERGWTGPAIVVGDAGADRQGAQTEPPRSGSFQSSAQQVTPVAEPAGPIAEPLPIAAPSPSSDVGRDRAGWDSFAGHLDGLLRQAD